MQKATDPSQAQDKLFVLRQMITRRLASLISFLFSPFVVPIAAILFLVRVYAQTWEQLMLWTTITVLFITIIPFIYIYIKVKQGKLPIFTSSPEGNA